MSLVWLITGTSSGFGNELVKQALARGDKVIATARDVAKIAAFKDAGAAVLALDITASQEELDKKAAEAIAIYGRIDVLVNNAAYTQFGTLEDLGEQYAVQFNTNVIGTANTTRAFLPHFRERRDGTIVNFGSMAAWITYPTVGAYSASKAAVRYITEALDKEVSGFNIRTLLVEPGYYRTELLGPQNSNFVETKIPDYEEITNATFSAFRGTHGKQVGDPVKAVARVIDVIRGENGAAGKEWPKELVLGSDAIEAIRTKCQNTLKMLQEWEDFSTGTDISG
ncbi:NAD(P)-binding protein [Aspergillus steynii IBT 23096]|uniref:NAD(P)-binding protein n=1 Tax=Aspergillus steynii IBT 23096 TaxID=1392250 RepID=A0A2I2GA67_9EURO|nr:NAD(P)-binding protein [Aspergillus steynii IBT 23096]PLB49775.1 NAD(P)-binding protein [Aspergillus steynii IBT 23096]